MNSIEFEESIWTTRMRDYRFPEVDIINEGFRPKSGRVADFCSVQHDGRHHFFYIERRLTEGLPGYPGNECYIGHASTANFFDWEVHYPEIWVQPNTWEHLIVAAPNIIYYRDRFVMAYLGINQYGTQNLGIAFSDDLFHWERWEGNPLSPCKEKPWAFWREDGPTSCRDAHLFVCEGQLCMAYTANTRDGASCIALTTTQDLEHWQDCGPIFTGPTDGYEHRPDGSQPQGQLESSNLIRKGDRWFLLAMFDTTKAKIQNWIFESDRMDHFEFSTGREFWHGAYTTEVVKEKGQRSLLACADSIKFGVVDWAASRPTARYITSREELLEWSKA